MSGTERSAAALSEVSGFARILDSPEITGLAIRFWDAKEYDADYEGMHLSVRLHDWVTTPFMKGAEKSRAKGEIIQVRATVGGIPIAELEAQWPRTDKQEDELHTHEQRPGRYVSKPPERFELMLYDAGYYSHSEYKSFVKHPSPVLAAAIERILMAGPTDLGHISLKDDVIAYHGKRTDKWVDAREYLLLIPVKDTPKRFVNPFWKPPVIRKGKQVEEIPIEESDLERIQGKIDVKETAFNKYIEKLYEDDAELAKKLDLSPVGVAKLIGDNEYEALLKQRDEIMWSEAPTASLGPS